MKNVLEEQPNVPLHGRLKASVNFVADKDIENKQILDIGCGFGWSELNFLKRGTKKIVGLEISEDNLKSAKKYIHNKRVVFAIGSALKIPLPGNSVDTVVSWEVIEHIPVNTENLMYKEIYRVLKKNGVFYLSTPFDSLASKALDPAWWLIGHRHYSSNQLKAFGKNNGFIVDKIQIKGKWWSLFSELNMYFSKWILRKERIMRELFFKKANQEFIDNDGFSTAFVKYIKK